MNKKVFILLILVLTLSALFVGLGMKEYNASLNTYNKLMIDKEELSDSIKEKEVEYTDTLLNAKKILITYGYINNEELNSLNNEQQIALIHKTMKKYTFIELSETQKDKLNSDISSYYKKAIENELDSYPSIKHQVSVLEVKGEYSDKLIPEAYITDINKLVSIHNDKLSVEVSLTLKDNTFKEIYEQELVQAIESIIGNVNKKDITIK